MTTEKRLEDVVAWGTRLNPNEAMALLNNGKVIKTLYLDGSQYLRVELSIIDTSVSSQIIGGEE